MGSVRGEVTALRLQYVWNNKRLFKSLFLNVFNTGVQMFRLNSVNHFRLHSSNAQVKIHRFASNFCVFVAESASASPRGAMVETAKRTAEKSSSTPLSKSLSLLGLCAACWS